MALGVLEELAHVGPAVVELEPETPDAILEPEGAPRFDGDVDPLVALLRRRQVEPGEPSGASPIAASAGSKSKPVCSRQGSWSSCTLRS